MSLSLQKTVVTLGELFAADAERLMRRNPKTEWLALLQPVIARNSVRSEDKARFERHEGAHPAHPAPIGPRKGEVDEAAADAGEPLPGSARDRLRPLVGSDAVQARMHKDKLADAFARSHQSDAVTVDKHVYFRSGTYAPETPVGLGLIAHELTHVAENNRPGIGWRRSTQEDTRNEEQLARSLEHVAARNSISPIVAPVIAAPRTSLPPAALGAGRASAVPASVPAQLRPMRADVDRTQPDPIQAPPQQGPSLDVLRRSMVRDIIKQVRVDFERGA